MKEYLDMGLFLTCHRTILETPIFVVLSVLSCIQDPDGLYHAHYCVYCKINNIEEASTCMADEFSESTGMCMRFREFEDLEKCRENLQLPQWQISVHGEGT